MRPTLKQRLQRSLATGERAVAFAAGCMLLTTIAATTSVLAVSTIPLWVPPLMIRNALDESKYVHNQI
jgi:hypothetical protein